MSHVITLDQRSSTSTYQHNVPPDKPVKTYWRIREYSQLLNQMEQFMETVLETGQIPFSIRQKYGHYAIVRNGVGLRGYLNLAGFLPSCDQFMDLYRPDQIYRADLQLFFDCYQQHQFAKVMQYETENEFGMARIANFYNDFISTLRIEAMRYGVKKRLSDARANLLDQEAAIRRYLLSVTTHNDYLTPLRMDLFYSEMAIDTEDAMERVSWNITDQGLWIQRPSIEAAEQESLETRARIDTSTAMADRDRFFENRRGADKVFFNQLAGYVCKLEQGGRHRVNHFHCNFLLEGRVSKAKLNEFKNVVAERWRVATRGQGLTYDCHARMDEKILKEKGMWAIDPFSCGDHPRVADFVNYVARYFSKDDGQMIRSKPAARSRTLTMGQAPCVVFYRGERIENI